MSSKKLFIKNGFGENLETLKEYKTGKDKYPAVLMVPGLSMDLHEWGGSFDKISKYLVDNGFLTYRFSFAGCGKSEGAFKEMTISRQAKQVQDVLNFIEKEPLVDKKRIGILAQSIGGPSVIAALPLKIKSLIFLSSVFDPEKSLTAVCQERKAYNPKGVSSLPRSDGTTTRLGSKLWLDLKKLNLRNQLKKYSPPYLLILHGALDTIVAINDVKKIYKYTTGKKEVVIYPEGDHGLEEIPKPLRRKVLDKICVWFKKTL